MDEKSALSVVLGKGYLAPSLKSWKGSIGAWLAEVHKRTGSMRTPTEYYRLLSRFLSTLAGGPETATSAHVHAFAYGPGPAGDWRSKGDPSPSTILVRRSAISSFYSFAVSHELLKNNPAEGVARPKSRKPPIRGLNVEEWKALIEAIPNNASGKRDQAIILTMTLTGRRRSEVMGMRVGDLTRNGRVYYNVRVKGGEYVKKELPAPAFQAICDHLKDTGRAIDTLTAEDKLFPVSSAAFYANLKRYAKKANISGVVTPHVFRHTAAKLRQEAGQKLEDISAFLGHADISTTARYLRRIVGEEDAGWRGVYALLGA